MKPLYQVFLSPDDPLELLSSGPLGFNQKRETNYLHASTERSPRDLFLRALSLSMRERESK